MAFVSLFVLLAAVALAVKNVLMVKMGENGVDVNFNAKGVKGGILILAAGVVISYVLASIVVIGAGNRGAIFNVFVGVQEDNVLFEGMHVVPKVINTVTLYDVRTNTWSEEINCLSSDGLPMVYDVSIRYRINPVKVATIKKNVGSERNVLEKILIPTARSKMRDISAMFTAQEAYAHKRIELQVEYQKLLEKYFESENYLVPEQILVRKVTPPIDLTRKIQETKVAEQNVVKQKNILEAKRIEKQQSIVEAEAHAQALKIKGAAIAKSPQIISKEWIDKWNGVLPTYMMGDSQGVMINLGNVKK